MATQAATDLSFIGVTNITSFADLCRYAHWPEDIKAPPLFTGIDQDELKMMIQKMNSCIIDITAVHFPELGRELKRIEELEIVNTDNFKSHLSLQISFEEWFGPEMLSGDTVNEILIPEAKQVIREAEKQTNENRHMSFIHAFHQEVRKAFKASEKAHGGYQSSSARLCETLDKYHDWFRFEEDKYLSPYTSIVGPSGTGKTYSVSQLAVQHGKYVIYLNFAPERANGFPRRSSYASLILDALNRAGSTGSPLDQRAAIEWKWSLIVEALLHLARLARTFGIGPADFFDYQTDQDCGKQQNLIASSLQFAIYKPPFLHKPGPNDDWKPFDTYCQQLFSSAGHKVKRDTRSNTFISDNSTPPLQFVLCIDEARNLLTGTADGEPNLLFRTLRTALWNSATGGEKTFFAVFLDTAPKIFNFFPTIIARDPSQKVPTYQRSNKCLFPHIYQSFTKNIFASPTPALLDEPNTDWRQVFTFGRPLWGALLQQGSTEDNVFQLCQEKCDPDRIGFQADYKTVARLALLSYRIPFTVCRFSLAEGFVSGWMHGLANVSEDREDLKVMQPTDPILAMAAQDHGVTMAPNLVKVLEAFENALYWNHVNVRDVGEFIAGMILLLAFDATSCERYFKPVLVQSFLGSLLGHSIVKKAEKVFKDCGQSKVKTMLLEGNVFFNRIQRRVTVPKMADIYNMYRSCTACYLPTSFNGVDILIPVWIPRKARRNGRFGCILIQVKNQAHHSVTPDTLNSAYRHTEDGFQKLEFDNEVPIIGLMMCLRGTNYGTEVRAPSGNSRKNLGVILCVGLDSKQYPIFHESQENKLAQVKQQVLRLLESLLCDVHSQKLEKTAQAYESLKFENEFFP
ncbi:hypothetical protein CFIMG_007646RA00001 [Ceratocystis fimbriata CBS 114723]|uniref:Uncharacterized protein n=1 Tax=Ceratocystis fimbriata CBS 114723 TaxID=1035309 RepID=A0A2C5XED6_9PEZI|nr:hypothetical protein CFIMG_007646RA00001 [Ceratocystis fimbriata CBS 114723]